MDTAPFPAVEPLDVHNQRLLENAPPAWRNPGPKDHYHLVVIGAGTGGLVTAAIGSALGARVALVERELMGGDCLNVGCVPSKGIIHAARAWRASSEGPDRFGAPRASGDGDSAVAMERMRRIRADISPVDSASRYRGMGVDVFLGEGRFVSEDTVEVDGKRLRFRPCGHRDGRPSGDAQHAVRETQPRGGLAGTRGCHPQRSRWPAAPPLLQRLALLLPQHHVLRPLRDHRHASALPLSPLPGKPRPSPTDTPLPIDYPSECV
jgi:hypothetical protein